LIEITANGSIRDEDNWGSGTQLAEVMLMESGSGNDE